MRQLLAFALTAVAVAATPIAAQASQIPPGWRALGGVNLTAYCARTYGDSFKSALLGPTAGDWRCVPIYHHAGGQKLSISVQDACRMEYGRPNALADAVWSQPLSWTCYAPRFGRL
jgi:hypothetical protein